MVVETKKAKTAVKRPAKPISRLKEIKAGNSDRIVTGINEFNRVMGGGIVRDSIRIITA